MPTKNDIAQVGRTSSVYSRQQIWQWWNRRRFQYNRDLFLVGISSGVLVIVLGSATVQLGEDFVEPLILLYGPPFYAICANIAYTAGPIYDTIFYCGEPRKKLFKAGYFFSLILTSSPGIWTIIAYLKVLITGEKL